MSEPLTELDSLKSEITELQKFLKEKENKFIKNSTPQPHFNFDIYKEGHAKRINEGFLVYDNLKAETDIDFLKNYKNFLTKMKGIFLTEKCYLYLII